MPKDRLTELKEKSGDNSKCEEKDILLEVITDNKSNDCLHQLSAKTKAIKESLWGVQEQITILKSLQEKILSSTTNQQSSSKDVDKLAKSISATMAKVAKDLKDFNLKITEDYTKKKLSETELRMARNMQSSLIKEFQTIWEDLCSVHNLYESKCKRRIQRQLEIAGYNLDDEAIDNVMINGTSVFMKEFGECEAAKLALRDQQDRHQELLSVEKSIEEMRDLFVQLSLLVECQGETIDRIEANVSGAADKVVEGTECLDTARKKQNSFRKKKIICISLLSGVLILAIIIALASVFGS